MSINCDVIMFFTIFGQFGAIQKPNSGHRVCKFTFSITITGTRYDMKFYASVAKGLKLGVKMFWRLIPTFVEVTEEKLVGELSPPTLPHEASRIPCFSQHILRSVLLVANRTCSKIFQSSQIL